MNVSSAVRQRKTTRAFLDTPVDQALLRDLIGKANRAPSNGNLQPWRVFVTQGDTLATIKREALKQLKETGFDQPEYGVYPSPLKEPYRTRRFQIGEALYQLIGVEREDKAGRYRQFDKNAELFGAPVGIFFYIDRALGPAQWMDLGMYIQTLMLLLEEQGLNSCAQGYWSMLHHVVTEQVQPGDSLMLACGLAVGYADDAELINTLTSPRAPLEEFAQFFE